MKQKVIQRSRRRIRKADKVLSGETEGDKEQKVYYKKQKEIQKQWKQLKLKEKQNQSRKSPKRVTSK